MRLHILTAVTRPENLPQIAASLTGAHRHFDSVAWHTREDGDRKHVGGQALKNEMIDQIDVGWVWICDDDNIAHPDLFERIAGVLAANEDARLIVIAQQHRSGWVRRPSRAMLKASHVDAGQVVIRRDAIGAHRIPLDYCGDGAWIEQIANSLDDTQIAYIREPSCYYNWLRSDP